MAFITHRIKHIRISRYGGSTSFIKACEFSELPEGLLSSVYVRFITELYTIAETLIISRDLEDSKSMTEDDDINSQIHSSQEVKEMSAPASSANEDDDSSTCGSSSSSDSSDSESDKEDEAENAESTHTDETLTSNGNDAVPSSGSNLPTRSKSSTSTPHTESNRLRNVNSNRAAARFRQQQNAELGLMALGTKKRDRRTIEEIQRDIQKKRGKTTCGTNGNLQNSKVKKSTLNNSPALSSDSGVEPTTVLSLNASSYKMPKGKANSARSRLAMKVFGRGGRSSLSNNAKTKKNAPSTGTTSIVTNISAGTMKKTTAISDSNGK